MEGLDVSAFAGVYAGKRVLVTGHTGFKGSWLCLWLSMLGAKVTALALPPEGTPNHFSLLGLDIEAHETDIRAANTLDAVVAAANPEVVFHLAAQSLVHRSYREPLATWATNVMGTANLLDACRRLESLAAVVVVTTDKCYRNNEWAWGYREIDPLGGHDPYSASKAGTELVAASFRDSYFSSPSSPLLATARAGNVIGGGDWSEDRLIPDLVRAIAAGEPLEIRSPRATRPWQHVLDCLSGYLQLGQRLIEGRREFAEAWNFGPEVESNRRVEDLLVALKGHWPDVVWNQTREDHPHEAQLLYLDSAKARQKLAWKPIWSFEQGIAATANWYQAFYQGQPLLTATQLEAFVADASRRGAAWCAPGGPV
jgi:CDP-glucose 4,6-dehydratase